MNQCRCDSSLPVGLSGAQNTIVTRVLVEMGEESALSSLRVDSLVKERMAYGVEFVLPPCDL